MTQAEFNAWIRARFNLWTKSDVDAAIKAEREACAKVIENKIEKIRLYSNEYYLVDCLTAIRARGEA